MWADDIDLVKSLVARYGPHERIVVDVGGLSYPCISSYDLSITAMAKLRERQVAGETITQEEILAAQQCRYLNDHRPLSFLDSDYEIANPAVNDGPSIETLWRKYDHTIGTAIILSVLEHVKYPNAAIQLLHKAMRPGGLVIVSVPFSFPYHPDGSGGDYWRFSPQGLATIFEGPQWRILECDWRLNIRADAGVLDIHTGEPQQIRSCYLCARST